MEGDRSQPAPALVLHAPIDLAFVRGYLVPALGGAGRELCALDAGGASAGELERAIRGSGVAIAVITPAFVADPWTRLSELLASSTAVAGERQVVPLVLEDCKLPLHLEAAVRLDFRRRADWDRETERLRRHLARPAPAPELLPCPYPGMRPFQAGDAAHFHGRGDEIDEVLGLIEAGHRELYVLGPSGSGKSSLIAAGVLPRLAARLGGPPPAILRPGDAPSSRLAEALGAGASVVFVDQLEELFTQAPAEEQARFAAGLRELRDDPGRVLLLALRADFFAELLQSELWLEGARRHLDLLPLRGAALREAIERPARALEVYFEPGLIDRLLADAAGEPGVLPLLQETLVQLWSQRRHRLLTLAAYEAMGEPGRSGLAVAISSRAARCLGEMAPPERVIARRILLRMVSFGEGRPNTRRRQTRTALAAGEPAAALDDVLRRLVAARLVTMDDDARSGDDRVELCHEVLVTAWPAFSEWVEARRADEQRRRQIQASAEDWARRGRGASGLLDADELAAAVAWRETDAARELGESAEVTALVDASRRELGRARRRRRRWAAGVFAGLAAVVVAALIARDQNRAADAERGKATRLLAGQYLETGRQLVVDGHPQRAIPYLVAARARGGDGPVLRRLFRTATRTHVVLTLAHRAAITSASFSGDGARILTAGEDRTVRIWDAATGAPLAPALAQPEPFKEVFWLPGDRRVVVRSEQTAWIWDLAPVPPSRIALPHGSPLATLDVSDDGARIATGGYHDGTRVWSASTGAPLSPLVPLEGFLSTLDLSGDGTRLVTTDSASHAVRVRDAITGEAIAVLEHPSRAEMARFSPDGARVAVTRDSVAHVWDAATGEPLLEPIEHPGAVSLMLFTSDGTQLMTATDRGAVQSWGPRGGPIFGIPLEHPRPLWTIDVSADGARVLTGCIDKSIRIWDGSSGMTITAPLDLEGGASAATFSPDGTRVLTAGADGVARVWEVAPMVSRLLPFDATDGGYSPDGAWIIAATYDGVGIWTASGERRSTLRTGPGTNRLAFAAGRARLAAITGMDRVQIWDPASGEMVAAPEDVGRRSQRRGNTPSFAFSPDGRRFASTVLADERTARIWDADTGRPVSPPLAHAERVMTVRWSPDGRRVVTASEDGTARVWDAASGKAVDPPLEHPGGHGVVLAMWSPDGARLATVSDRILRLWDAASLRPAGSLVGHADGISSAAFSPDGARIVTSSYDRTVRIWEVASGRLLATPMEHADRVWNAAFSADGERVVTSGDSSAQVWDAATGKALTPPLPHPATVYRAELHPGGDALLTVASDGLRIWDVGLDTRTLDEWRAIAATGAFPELARALGLAPAP